MAVDRNGVTVATGQVYLVAGPVRRIDGNTVVIVLDSGDVVRANAADICKVDDALAGGGGGGVTDHGALTGLADDDHGQYVLANGTRAFTGAVLGVDSAVAASLTTRGYVDGQISAISFFALANFQPLDATLTALAGHTTAANQITKWTGVDTCTTITVAAFGETLLATATDTAARSALGLQGAALLNVGTTAGTVAAGDDSRFTNDRTASGIRTATTVVAVSSSAAPAAGSTLVATSSTAAEWRPDEEYFADVPFTDVTMNASYADLCSKVMTLFAGDIVEIEVDGTIFNNTGATATYRWQAQIGTTFIESIDGTTVAASGSNRTPFSVRTRFMVRTTADVRMLCFQDRATPGVANLSLATAGTTIRQAWNTSTNNLVGANTIKLQARSSTATAGQQMQVYSYQIRRIPQRL